MTTEAQKRAKIKYDSANMAYQTIKVPKKTLEAFRQAVQSKGERVNTVLREYMEEYTRENSEE